MKKKYSLTAVLVLCHLMVFGQGAKNIKINEVMPVNTESIVDEYGEHLPWIELANISFTTLNVRGMYIATDTAVLNKSLTVPERVAKMSIIPNNETRTNMVGRQHLILYLNSNPAKGSTHLSSTLPAEGNIWIGLFEGNGVNLVDSVTIPMPLKANTSYARQKDGADTWDVKAVDAVTPGIENYINVTDSKVTQIKRDDPHGFGITLLSMGIVFSCLALLCIFFTLFGRIMRDRQNRKINDAKQAHTKKILSKMSLEEEDERAFPGVVTKRREEDPDVLMAVVAMALKEYLDDTHDTESGTITIIPKFTKWTRI